MDGGIASPEEEMPNDATMDSPASSNEQQVVASLFAVADANRMVTQLGRCLDQLVEAWQRKQAETVLLKQYEELDAELFEEQRCHQRESNAISEDKNQLNALTTPLRQECDQKRPTFEAKQASIDAKICAIEGAGMEESTSLSENLSPQNPVQFHLLLSLLQFLNQPQRQPMNGEQPPYWIPPPLALVPNPSQPKMKACQHCQRAIHRNAPTCPFCKQKITSKAAKRARARK